jgi:HSP20 family molecular chaperone IbpA
MTRDILTLFEGLPSVFDSNLPRKLFNDHGSWEPFYTKEGGFPYDVIVYADENGDSIKTEIVYAVAGVSRDNIKVKVENNTLEIIIDNMSQNDSINHTNEKGETIYYAHKGISSKSLQKRFTLGQGVDKNKIESKLENGLLTIILPTEKSPKPKAIDIKIK